jgi:hypothetical protein
MLSPQHTEGPPSQVLGSAWLLLYLSCHCQGCFSDGTEGAEPQDALFHRQESESQVSGDQECP